MTRLGPIRRNAVVRTPRVGAGLGRVAGLDERLGILVDWREFDPTAGRAQWLDPRDVVADEVPPPTVVDDVLADFVATGGYRRARRGPA